MTSRQSPTPPQLPEMPASEDALRRATGRGWDDWLRVLDEWGAVERRHSEVARWLADEHGISTWWAQTVTVGFERARNLRQKHEVAGGFSVSASKTVAASAERLSDAFTDAGLRAAWLPDVELRERTSRRGRSARFDWPSDGSRLSLSFTPKGKGKTIVGLQHEKLADATRVAQLKDFWRERLAALKALLEG